MKDLLRRRNRSEAPEKWDVLLRYELLGAYASQVSTAMLVWAIFWVGLGSLQLESETVKTGNLCVVTAHMSTRAFFRCWQNSLKFKCSWRKFSMKGYTKISTMFHGGLQIP